MLGNLFDETIQEWYSPFKKAVNLGYVRQNSCLS